MADCSNTEVFLSEWNRMCVFYQNCIKCDAHEIGCDAEDGMCERTPKLKDIVQKWSDEHPLPKPKTYADDFFEKFPKATRYRYGENDIPSFCIDNFYGLGKRSSCSLKCHSCWHEPYKEEETNG